MRARAAADLLALPVRDGDIELGRPVDVLVDLDAGRALGLEVRCRDETRRFLPLGAARIGADAVEVGSALTLLDDLAFYRARASSVRSLRGTAVRRAGQTIGSLEDLLVTADGALDALLVRMRSRVVRVPFAQDVRLDRERKISAA
jgi:hypothetical protein